MLAEQAGQQYDNYGTIGHQLLSREGFTVGEVEKMQRDRMEQQLSHIARAVSHLTQQATSGYISGGEGQGDSEMSGVRAVLQGEHGTRIAVAVTKVAEKVERSVKEVCAAAATPAGRQSNSPVPGSLNIKQVRRPSGKLHAAKSVAPATTSFQQPHIEVAVMPLGGGATSKWDDSSSATPQLTKGNLMVDTGAAVTLVTKAWAVAHGLKISSPPGISINGASGQSVEVVGTTQMTIQLTPTLEVDVNNVTVSSGDFYQGLLGCDLLKGKPGILGAATVIMEGDKQEGSIQWKQVKAGCIATTNFIAAQHSVGAASGEKLPPPPPRTPAQQDQPTTFEAQGVTLSGNNLQDLRKLALERDEQRR